LGPTALHNGPSSHQRAYCNITDLSESKPAFPRSIFHYAAFIDFLGPPLIVIVPVHGSEIFPSFILKAPAIQLHLNQLQVVIEMLNAFNAVSEDGSLLQMAPWVNPWLVAACMGPSAFTSIMTVNIML